MTRRRFVYKADGSVEQTVGPEFTAEDRAKHKENFETMLRTRKVPVCVTDDQFMNHFGVNGSQFANRPEQGDYYKQKAEAAGVSVKGKVYISQLANEPGDPRAWVSGRGDIQRICEERGWGVQGSGLNIKADNDVAPCVDPDAKYEVDDNVINSYCADLIEDNPEMVKNQQELDDLKESVRNKLSPEDV